EAALLERGLLVGAVLFGLGAIGLVVRRNLIVMFLCAEMMLQGVSVSLVAWGRFHNDWGGTMLVIFILTVAACEAGLALALFLTLFHRSGNLDAAHWQRLREADQPLLVDREIPEPSARPTAEWPELTPAGVEPDVAPDHEPHRAHV
ncbi:MAG: NADH-quinone oxidoreductase subunit NuoK, partial [Pirellulales bacterium]